MVGGDGFSRPCGCSLMRGYCEPPREICEMGLALGEITASLGPDAQKLWLTSFTVDEHEGYALLYRALGGRLAPNDVWLAFHRRAFRRAGPGVIPRQWLHPVDVPSESPLATYHPKIFLAHTSNDEYILIISTANLATDD